jgi:hypothetical protein
MHLPFTTDEFLDVFAREPSGEGVRDALPRAGGALRRGGGARPAVVRGRGDAAGGGRARPTTIFTLGVLLLARPRVAPWLVAIPFLWSLLGVSAAAQLGIREDLGLVVAGVLGTALLTWGGDGAVADRAS